MGQERQADRQDDRTELTRISRPSAQRYTKIISQAQASLFSMLACEIPGKRKAASMRAASLLRNSETPGRK